MKNYCSLTLTWEGFKLGLELDLSMTVDLEKRLWRMYQIKKDGYSHWLKDEGQGQE